MYILNCGDVRWLLWLSFEFVEGIGGGDSGGFGSVRELSGSGFSQNKFAEPRLSMNIC